MKVLIAPDKFKGSLTAKEACRAIEKGALKANRSAEVTILPLADGGEDSLEVIEDALQLKKVSVCVKDPLLRPITTHYGINGSDAYVEMALASGLQLLSANEQHPTKTSSFGTGQLIRHAIENGAKRIFVFAGGSATNDGGIGMAQALGFSFKDKNGMEIQPTGENLIRINSIDETENILSDAEITLLTDVKNKLLGPYGATNQYAKQKGATNHEVTILEKGLEHFANIVHQHSGRKVVNLAGSGAAGGVALSVVGLLNGSIESGIQTILKTIDFDVKLKAADLVITGEGKLDQQTLQGKVVQGVIKACNQAKTSVMVVCGQNELALEELKSLSISEIDSIKKAGLSTEYCMKNVSDLLTIRVYNMVKNFSKTLF